MSTAVATLPSPADTYAPLKALGNKINETALYAMESINRGAQVWPALHRPHTAIGISAGGAVGIMLANELRKNALFKYNPHVDNPADRWKGVFCNLLPILCGGVGALVGSNVFWQFHPKKVVPEAAQHLEDFYDVVRRDLAANAGLLTAATGGFGSASGLQFLPVASFGGFLSLRFLGMGGKNTVFPFIPKIGEWMTGTASHNYSGGPQDLMNELVQYLANEPDPKPEKVKDMARGFVVQFMKDLEGTPILEQFVADITALANEHHASLEKIEDPAQRQAAIKAFFTKTKPEISGQKYEQLMIDYGIDPRDTTIFNPKAHGVTGSIGAPGKQQKLGERQAAFNERFGQRWNTEQNKMDLLVNYIANNPRVTEEKLSFLCHELLEKLDPSYATPERTGELTRALHQYLNWPEGSGRPRGERGEIVQALNDFFTKEDGPFRQWMGQQGYQPQTFPLQETQTRSQLAFRA